VSWSKSSVSSGCKGSWSKSLVSACLDYVMFKIVSFSMSGLCHGQNCPFQHCWNVSWSKPLVSAWLDYFMVKIVSFSMTVMCHGQNRPF
jgi:hypothetical protein